MSTNVGKPMFIGQVGIKMSHPINEQIAEALFDKWYDMISTTAINLSEETISLLAEQAAKAEFENLPDGRSRL